MCLWKWLSLLVSLETGKTLQKAKKSLKYATTTIKSTEPQEAFTHSFRTLAICSRHHYHVLYKYGFYRIHLRAYITDMLSLFLTTSDFIFVRSSGELKPSTSSEVSCFFHMRNQNAAA